MSEQYSGRLEHFPVMFFAVVMGFGGLTLAWQRAGVVLDVPAIVGIAFSWISLVLFLLISAIYLLKLVRHTDQVKAELNHPVRINFFAAISISLLLMSSMNSVKMLGVSDAFWWIGTALQSFLTLFVVRFWIEKALEISHSSPAWFIPVVGNLIIPITSNGLVPNEVLFFYFSVGVFFWFVLFAVLTYRLVFHPQLAKKFMPTLFIFIAPPAIGFLNYLVIFGEVDYVALSFYNIALFFVILLLFMGRGFLKLPFFISWWAFVFPVAAMSVATTSLYHKINSTTLLVGSWVFLIATTILILSVGFYTIRGMLNRQICIEE